MAGADLRREITLRKAICDEVCSEFHTSTIPNWNERYKTKNTTLDLVIVAAAAYHFGMKKLKALRVSAKLSQEALAGLAHTSQPQIDRLEKGSRQLTLAWARRLAPHLGVKPLELLPIEKQDINLSSDAKNHIQDSESSLYDLLRSAEQEGEMLLPKSIIAAIGMLTTEIAALKEEVKELKSAQGGMGPGRARRN